ncbi:MAG: metal ABC transporter permease [Myxococcales bacterium]|nr:metal ABC transporter permease [Myxococcales bacterium]MCB9531840.1 metal ABC transporter permease [Myxococcales bacterium]
MIATLRDFVSLWELFRYPTLAGVLAGAALGLLGVYIVLRRMVFLSAALSQVASLGVAAGVFVQARLLGHPSEGGDALGWATALTLAVAIALTRSRKLGGDRALGFVFLGSWAGTLALGTRIVAELHDIESLLSGSAVAVLPDDFRALVTWLVPMLLLHVWWWRGFSAVTQDADDARVRGLPVTLLETALVISLAMGISVVTRVLGALPAFAFSVLPALAALAIAPNLGWALIAAAVVGATSGGVGYVVSYGLELPVGAAQALVGAALTLCCGAVAVTVARLRALLTKSEQ